MRPSTERPAHIMATWLSSVSFQTSNFHQKHQFISPTSMSSFKSSKDLLKSQRISCNPVLVSDSSSLSEIEPPSDVGLPARRPSILVDLWRRKLRIMEFRTQSCKTLKKAGVISHCQPCTIAGWTAHAVSPWSQPLGLDCPDGRANARGCHRNSPEHAIMKFIQVIEIWWKLMEIDGTCSHFGLKLHPFLALPSHSPVSDAKRLDWSLPKPWADKHIEARTWAMRRLGILCRYGWLWVPPTIGQQWNRKFGDV